MESLRTCPVCMEVPEREIYQCFEGHIICNLCISKVKECLCPQCRNPLEYGTKRVRCRVLEQLLDSQVFECKFKDEGCTQLVKRGEMTNHANWCVFNSARVVLCKELGQGFGCKFKLGCVSRAEVIAHFKSVHMYNSSIDLNGGFISGKTLMTEVETLKIVSFPIARFYKLYTPEESETSPLFFMIMTVDKVKGLLNAVCVKVWDEDSNNPSSQYVAEIRLIKDLQGKLGGSTVNAFPIGGSMMVCGLKEAHHLLKASPVNFPLSLLEEWRFGVNIGDRVEVKISEIGAVAPL